jgi:flagellar hook-basal body complex protein FliE
MLDVIWMDCDTLAERLGIERESARQRANRGQWARRKDNTGKMQVGVPAEVLEAPPERLPDRPSDRVHEHGHEPDATTDVNAVLTRHIERLEQALETAQEKSEALERERDDARAELRATEKARDALSAQVEALNTVLAIERERTAGEQARVEEWKAVADRFASQAERLTEAAESRRGWWPWKRRA